MQYILCFLKPLFAAQQHAVSAVVLTLLWISSLTVGRALFFLFTSSSSTRGLMVIPWNRDKNKLNKLTFNVLSKDKTTRRTATFHQNSHFARTCTKTVKRMTTMVVVMKSLFFGKSSIRKTREKQMAPLRPP